ncbi:hypothetical protein DEU56DRAFT_862757 [Suillus clintonianus]|uniref:uncharacterized protein n=1 Tax=Suillus clintonianus TaxID=1904413 RepID=UPI001B85FD36|nr:uncharacterized protein DEU56DRAFT_862757 [Suillus clintonianus]KAG2125697.1 hypothetical protein DEU56DRAFT_862757 [Suillus clintonianus]
MTGEVLVPHDVQTTLNFYKPINDELPYNYVEEPPVGVLRTNIGQDVQQVVVHDIRGKEDTVGLDKTGFQFVTHKSVEKDFVDEEAIQTKYYAEVEDILKKHTGAKRVVIFDHTLRRNPVDGVIRANDARGPVERVHVDQTYAAAIGRVYRHLGDDAERLLKGRVRIINVWRPIANPVAHKPLAVANYRTLGREDLVSTRHIYPNSEGSTFSVRYNPTQRWYFLANQTPDEVTLIKCYDSDEDKARLTPHSAFLDVTSPKDAPNRQSIEVRALVFENE